MTPKARFGDVTVSLIHGDIALQEVDVIVNAANSGLRGGGGVDGAIHAAGGPAIMEACRQIGHCPTGQAVLTTAGNLLAKSVIHTVGPIWQGGASGEPEALASCYKASLQLADHQKDDSIAFPAISTGVYGYPLKNAAEVALLSVQNESKSLHYIRDVRMLLYTSKAFMVYEAILSQLSA